MSYGVYYRESGSKLCFLRFANWVKSPRSKSGGRFVDVIYSSEREALEKAEDLASRGYEVKIKTLRG